jgi:hypothetical protein
MNDIRISDVWRDANGKHWRVAEVHADHIAMGRCNKTYGRFLGGGKRIDVPREQFLATHTYVGHASL